MDYSNVQMTQNLSPRPSKMLCKQIQLFLLYLCGTLKLEYSNS